MVDSSSQSLLHQSLEVLDKIGASPDDARDFRLQRKLLERRGVRSPVQGTLEVGRGCLGISG